MPRQWRNQIWQSLEEGAGRRCSSRSVDLVVSVRAATHRTVSWLGATLVSPVSPTGTTDMLDSVTRESMPTIHGKSPLTVCNIYNYIAPPTVLLCGFSVYPSPPTPSNNWQKTRGWGGGVKSASAIVGWPIFRSQSTDTAARRSGFDGRRSVCRSML